MWHGRLAHVFQYAHRNSFRYSRPHRGHGRRPATVAVARGGVFHPLRRRRLAGRPGLASGAECALSIPARCIGPIPRRWRCWIRRPMRWSFWRSVELLESEIVSEQLPIPVTVRTYEPRDREVVKRLYVEGLIGGHLAPNDTGLDIEDVHGAYLSK